LRNIFPPLIEASELKSLINLDSTILIDVRTGPNAKAAYETEHLKGARFVDLDAELAEIHENAAFGGRHPLPSIENFSQFLGRLGISTDSHVIVYDDKNGANAAARFWWMLKAFGHEKVQVINGGLRAALINSIPSNSGNEIVQSVGAYPANDWNLGRVSMSEVEEATQSNNHIIIDVRDADRYNGLTEPIDLVAGHIPSAINVPFTENLDENGHFLPSEQLNEKYSTLCGSIPSKQIIVHCGSGVTACHTLLAFAHAGLEIPQLYVGSWSEWSRNDKPMEGNTTPF
jgi:thiosulfate/3-mercaptopyruvate sulfurtransferase